MAFPTTSTLDSFVRTAENPLSDGGSWETALETYGSPPLKTNGTQALASTNAFNISTWAAQKFALPIEVYVGQPVLASGTDGAYVLWLNEVSGATPTGYFVYVRTGGAWTIYRADTGGNHSLATGTTTLSAGDSFGMSISKAGLITAWHKTSGTWASLGTATDTTYTGSGYLSLAVDDSTARFTPFGGGVVTVSATGSGAAAFSGSGTGIVKVTDTASGALAFAGTATATVKVPASGSGALAFAGTGTAGVVVPAAGSGALAFSGTATATASSPTLVVPAASAQSGGGGGRLGKKLRLPGTTIHANSKLTVGVTVTATGMAVGDTDEDELELVLALFGA